MMTMAEKQYKNYDERFLKEESSGSRPVIEYTLTNTDEVLNLDDQHMVLKGKFLDGSYCQNENDLKKLFLSGAMFSYTAPEMEGLFIYLPTMFHRKYSSAEITAIISENILSIVDAPTFEQRKPSKS